MKFRDYTKCVEINQLLVAMGISTIPALPAVTFERKIFQHVEREYLNPEDIRIGERLVDSGIPVRKSDIAQGPDDLLEYKGRKVVAYIRDQKVPVNFNQKRSNYRYHLCNCSTMQSMRDIGREHRYLATRQNNEMFEVHDLTEDPVKKGIVRMKLCKNCEKVLRQRGQYSYPFDLEQYFKDNDSYIPKTIKKIEEVPVTQTYSPKQGDYSREYRKSCHYKCQLCGVDCSKFHDLVHLHHVDGNPHNNQYHNLRVLCVDCHSKQPMHKHMRENPEFEKDIRKIANLRGEQGLF